MEEGEAFDTVIHDVSLSKLRNEQNYSTNSTALMGSTGSFVVCLKDNQFHIQGHNELQISHLW